MRPLLAKLGVKADSKVAVLGFQDATFQRQLENVTAQVCESKIEEETDLIFVAVERRQDLDMLKLFRHYLKEDGAIWVVYPKSQQEIREGDIIAAGRKAGLVETDVVSFSGTHCGLRLVILLESR
jgi:hypothetical protein